MNDRIFSFISFSLGLFFLGWAIGFTLGENKVMRNAYELGFAVQCAGQKGHFWSCPND